MRFLFVILIQLIVFTNLAQSITITSPNGGEFYNANSSQIIEWTSTGSLGNLELYYSTDNGSTWTLYASGINYVSGSYVWTVPNNPSNVCLIKLSNGTIQDESDAVFSINFSNNSLTLISPNGGQNYVGNSLHTVTWSTSGPVASLTMSYSLNNGLSWTVYATGISPMAGTYNWTVPNVTSNQCKVKLSDGIASAESNATFSINAVSSSTITVVQPNGGETLNVNTQYNVQWTTSGTVNPVDLLYSTDNGSNWTTIATGLTVNNFDWLIPNSPSTLCKVRVTDGTIADLSNAVFSIVDPTSISITTPNGGEVLQGFDTYDITWDTVSNGHIDSVELSFKENTSFNTMLTVLNNGKYTWQVPNVTTTSAKINVKLQGLPLNDSSAASFTINPIQIELLNPNGGEILVGGEDYEINWNHIGTFSGVDIFASFDNGVTFSSIATAVLDTFFVWNVPNFDTINCLISLDYQSFISDTSDAVFAIQYIDPSASIKEFNQLNHVQVYPNPSIGVVRLKNNLNQSVIAKEVVLRNINGSYLAQFQNISNINLSQFSKGIYLLEITVNDGTKQFSRVVLE